jgi:hypothetical protein
MLQVQVRASVLLGTQVFGLTSRFNLRVNARFAGTDIRSLTVTARQQPGESPNFNLKLNLNLNRSHGPRRLGSPRANSPTDDLQTQTSNRMRRSLERDRHNSGLAGGRGGRRGPGPLSRGVLAVGLAAGPGSSS